MHATAKTGRLQVTCRQGKEKEMAYEDKYIFATNSQLQLAKMPPNIFIVLIYVAFMTFPTVACLF